MDDVLEGAFVRAFEQRKRKQCKVRLLRVFCNSVPQRFEGKKITSIIFHTYSKIHIKKVLKLKLFVCIFISAKISAHLFMLFLPLHQNIRLLCGKNPDVLNDAP